MTFDELKLRALAELEIRRRNKTLTDNALSFDSWLPVVSPTYCWNWRHLEYIRREGLDGLINGSIKRLALFMPPRHGKCLVAGSRVHLSNGQLKEIEKIRKNDKVVSLDSGYNLTVSKVKNIFENGVKPLLKITIMSGREIICTDNHPLLTVLGWKEAAKFKIGDSIASIKNVHIVGDKIFPFGLSSLMGYIIGDGSFGKGDSIVNTACKATINHLEEIAKFHDWFLKKDGKYSYHIRRWRKQKGRKQDGSSAKEMLAKYMVPSKSINKRVPECIFQSDKDELCKFLAAYFNCDGYINDKREGLAEYYSTSEFLLRDVQFLLSKLGIYSSLRKKNGRYKGELHISWRLNISGQDLIKFSELIPVIGIKGQKLRKTAISSNKKRHFPEYESIPNGWKLLLKKGLGYHRLKNGIRADKNYKIGTARHIVQKLADIENNEELKKICSPGIIWERIINIERINNAETYDIEVEKTHNFIVDNIVSHNSEQITIRYPAWFLEKDATQRVIIGAYNQTLAEKFSRKTRRIAQARVKISYERKAVSDWETEAGGGLRAVGVGGGVTGMGANLIIVDDPVKSREEANSETYRNKVYDWYTDDLFTRLEPGGCIILIMTRWHEDDLAGRLINGDQAHKWKIINLPAEAEENDPLGRQIGQALCPERFDEAALKNIKEELKESYLALYQQRPSAVEGEIFKRDWWRSYSLLPYIEKVVHSWDTAFKKGAQNDYSVCTVWGVAKDGYYVLHRWKDKVEFPELKKIAVNLAELYPPDQILVEDKASGQSLIQELNRETRLPIFPIKVDIDKVARANSVTPLIQAGKVFLPQSASWLDDFLNNLSSFPNAAHDDDVDSLTQFLLNEKDMARQLSFLKI